MKYILATLVALACIVNASCNRSPSVFAKGMIQIKCPTQQNAQFIADNVTALVVNGYTMALDKASVVEADGGYLTQFSISVSDSASRRILSTGKPIGTWSDVEEAVRKVLSDKGQSFPVSAKHVGVHGFNR